VASGLPSSQTAPPMSFISGVADVAFGRGGKLFALIAGAGCSHGLAGTPNEIVQVHRDRSVTTVADLSAFLGAHPVANPDAADFEADGTWYSFVTAGRGFYAVEPNHQELDKISGDGHVTRVIDFSAFLPGQYRLARADGAGQPRRIAVNRHADAVPGPGRRGRGVQGQPPDRLVQRVRVWPEHRTRPGL
jgi:hypothetical protein